MALPQYAGIFKHKFREEYPSKSCVYKIWARDHFFIWKGQHLHNSMYHICGDMERWIRLGPKPEHSFYQLVKYIIDNKVSEIDVEVILMSDDVVELLKCERTLLRSESNNPLCLNVSSEPHISKKWVSPEGIALYNERNNS